MLTDDQIDEIGVNFQGNYLVLRSFARKILAEVEGMGYKILKNSTQEERSYTEDSTHENGNYSNLCCVCGRQFIGYKRRVICKVCAKEQNDQTN